MTDKWEDDSKKEKIPEVRQNELSSKFTIGAGLGIILWVVIFMLLKSMNIISDSVMRICIYPVIIGLILFYLYVKSKRQ